MSNPPGVERCNRYARGVLDGKIPAPNTIKQACQRYFDDLADKEAHFYFDEVAANNAVSGIERFKHANGEWQGTFVKLEDWQCFVVCNLFGFKWLRNRYRRFRRAYMRIPRKNGKSFLAVCIALLMFGPDREPGAQVFVGATSRDNAVDLLFDPAKFVVKQSRAFAKKFGIEINASAMVIPGNNSFFKPVIKKPSDGSSPHCAVVDEYHLHANSEQFDVFDTGMGARRQPLLLVTTTAGENLSCPCYDMDEECKNLLDGDFEDDARFVMIYGPDETDDWRDFETWRKVNPNMGVSVSEDYLREQLQTAKRNTSKQNDIRRKHVNEWVGATTAWINPLLWQKQTKPDRFEEFRDCPAHFHVDLASRKDLVSIVGTWKKGAEFYTKQWFFCAEAALDNNPKYQNYAKLGEITVTPGSKTDQHVVEEKCIELHNEFDMQVLAFDDYQGDYIMSRLMDRGLPVVNYPMNVKNFSTPMKEVEAAVLAGELFNDGNSCMLWQMGCVVYRKDEKENIFPRKQNKHDEKTKIDGPVGLIGTMGTWLAETEQQQPDISYV